VGCHGVGCCRGYFASTVRTMGTTITYIAQSRARQGSSEVSVWLMLPVPGVLQRLTTGDLRSRRMIISP
jgi:hypothetical protein